MLIYSMSVSVDGFISDREGSFGWTIPSEELFRFHISQVRELGGYVCGRRLYETMLVWDTDPSLRDNELGAAFADVWCSIRRSSSAARSTACQGNARLAEASLAEEAAAALVATDKDVGIGGAGLAAQPSSSASSTSSACSAFRSSSVEARRSCRRSLKTSRWTWSKPGRSARA